MSSVLAAAKRVLRSRPFLIMAGVVAAYFAFAYLAVDPLARWLLPRVGESQLASRLQAQRVQFDPLRLTLTVDGLRLARRDGAPLAGFERLVVDLEASGLADWAWRLRDIRLSAPQVTLDIAPDGTLNWAELIARLNEDKEPSDTIPRVLIEHLLIERGHVEYLQRNRATPFRAVLQPLGLELDGLSTLPEDRGDYSILARLPEQGGTLKWKGDIALNPLASSGAVAIEGVGVARLLAIVKAELPARVTEGEAAAHYRYRFAMLHGEPQDYPYLRMDHIGLRLTGIAAELPQAQASIRASQLEVALPALTFTLRDAPQLQLQDMRLTLDDLALARQGEAMFGLKRATASGIEFDLAARRLRLGEVALSEGMVDSRRGRDGSSDWQQLAAALAGVPAETESPEAAPPAGKPLDLSVGRVELQQWRLRHQDQGFVHALDLSAGQLGLGFALDYAGGALAVRDFSAELRDIALKSALQPQPVATLASLRLQDGALSLQEHSARLAGVVLSGLQTQLLRPAGKPLNWQGVLETVPSAKAAAPAAATAAGPAWKFDLGRLALEQAALQLEDRSVTRPVRLDIRDGMVELRELSLDLKRALPLKARLQVRQGGALEVAGKLTPQPFKADLQLKLGGLALVPFSPYLNQAALLKLDDGRLDVQGKLALQSGKAVTGSFAGGFGVRQLAISEEAGGAPFLAWQEVSSNSVKYTLAPARLHLDELRVVRPVGKFIIHEDGSLNIKRILRPSPEPAPAAAQPAGSGEAFAAVVERVSVADASLEFADLTLRPQFGTHIDALGGVINGLSTDPATTAQLELDGKVDEFGSARIRGALQPFRATDYTDLQLTFRNLEMNRLTPYSGKFAGRRIDSGKLSVDLQYKIKQRQLAGENKFVINKIKLGERVESRDAVDLPLDLAIAILEDSDGVIDLDLPISGSLDDPQFSYGKIIWKAIANVITKIVTAPFRALGKLLGLGGEEMQDVGFDAGSAALAPQEQEKLKLLAEAMGKRPALQLTIVPAYDPAADTAALQEQATRRDVLLESGLKLREDEQPGPLDLNNVKVQSAIERLLKQRSGGGSGSRTLDNIKDYFRKAKPEDLPRYSEMLAQLRLTVKVPETQLVALARSRAGGMQDYLTKSAGLAAERVGLAEPVKAGGDGKAVNLRLELGTRPAAKPAQP